MITVKDKSAAHNFHIFGPGVAKVVTTVPFVGTKKITVTLKKGTYTYQCDPHATARDEGHLQGHLSPPRGQPPGCDRVRPAGGMARANARARVGKPPARGGRPAGCPSLSRRVRSAHA